jgi:hypothetical protein
MAIGLNTQALMLLQVVGEHSLQLQPDERLLCVSWQNLGSGTPLEPQQVAGALLTTQRLLLVTGDLQVLASVDSRGDSVGVPHPITSFVWAGPALLYMTAAGQVSCWLPLLSRRSCLWFAAALVDCITACRQSIVQ